MPVSEQIRCQNLPVFVVCGVVVDVLLSVVEAVLKKRNKWINQLL